MSLTKALWIHNNIHFCCLQIKLPKDYHVDGMSSLRQDNIYNSGCDLLLVHCSLVINRLTKEELSARKEILVSEMQLSH